MLFSIVASPVTFPPRLWEDSLFCTFSAVFILCRAFQWWPLWPVWGDTSLWFWFTCLIITDVEYLPMCFCYFTPCEYNLSLESAFLKVGPVRNSFPMIYPETFLEGRCHLQPCQTLGYLARFLWYYFNLNQLIALCPLQLSCNHKFLF